MAVMRFDLQDKLEELQARIYLDTRKRPSKKELLELIFQIGLENYDLIIQRVLSNKKTLDKQTIKKVLSMAEDLGPGSEDLSLREEDIVYGNEEKCQYSLIATF